MADALPLTDAPDDDAVTALLAEALQAALAEHHVPPMPEGLEGPTIAPGLGVEVGGGGRYDTLLARFGRPLPAVGFMLGLDRVAFADVQRDE